MNKKAFGLVGIVIIVAVLLVIGGGIGYYKIAKSPSGPALYDKKNEDKLPPPQTQSDESAGWKTYRNEEYGFEFKYPDSIAPITFYERAQLGCSLASFFYESTVVEESLAKNPPDKKPNASWHLSLCLVNTGNSQQSLRDFIGSRYYSELAAFFKETMAGELQAMELIDQPERGYSLVTKLSPGIFIELGTRTNLKILRDVQPTLSLIK